jgi:D-alanyl-lipoteichoic acid acyltransferase DltB (MBOAT superfamily)
MGISFYTFKNVSYSIDVYRRTLPPEKHAGMFALYVAFFPQLLAGPIERATRLLPQLHRRIAFDDRKVVLGLRMILWGLLQKMVVADNLAPFVNLVYSDPAHATANSLLIATLLFAFQIYYDFAGYSDIAIGTAQVLGYETMKNFNRPYSSRSIREFWGRWHISLSSWLRDYLYIPLGGNRVPVPRRYLNLMVVFLLCGLWHGANWTFVVWGGIHGFYLVFASVTADVRGRMADRIGLSRTPRLLAGVRQVTTFLLVSFAWIFFRADTLSDAILVVSRLFAGIEAVFRLDFLEPLLASGPAGLEAIMGLIALLFSVGLRFLFEGREVEDGLKELPSLWRWSVYYIMLVGILLFGHLDSAPFIYFQF